MKKRVDFLVIGGGPSGHRAAIQAAKAGRSVVLVERGHTLGGECVHRGTIPSKTLRESAMYLDGLRQRSEGVFDVQMRADTKVASLMRRMKKVREGHETYMGRQAERNGVEHWQGLAAFRSPHEVEVVLRDGGRQCVKADFIVIATGSHPRRPEEVPIDHEIILDSDSILSLIYLPKSLVVLGAGVIACEFASVFASLGVEVTMVDRHERPLGFLDPELTDEFVRAFENRGGRFVPSRKTVAVTTDGYNAFVELEGGEKIQAEKCLCALGRVANVNELNLGGAGLELTESGLITVDDFGRTEVPHIYGVGDVVGPPALAATAVMQGRIAVRHALGLPTSDFPDQVPVGIYTIPEIASVGLTEAQAIQEHGAATVGRARFGEIARGHINGHTDGLLKLVADEQGEKLLGAHIVGEGATELIHVAQMALYAGLPLEAFLDNVFNFPTLAEAYRVAALNLVGQMTFRQTA